MTGSRVLDDTPRGKEANCCPASTRTPRPDSAGDASSIMNGSRCRVGSGGERGAPIVRSVPNRHEPKSRKSPAPADARKVQMDTLKGFEPNRQVVAKQSLKT